MPIRFVRFVFTVLRIFRLDRFADRLYWSVLHGFRPTSRWHPEAFRRSFALAKKYKTINKGDYYEFGIYKGYALWYAQNIASTYGANAMRFYGFDSFAGLPEVSGVDAGGDFYTGQFACKKEDVIHNLKTHHAHMDRIFLIEGYFEHSLKENIIADYAMRKATIILVDCDLYASTMEVLRFAKRLFMKHTLILFDDWNSHSGGKQSGEQLAFTQFCKDYPTFTFKKMFSYGWHGQVFQITSV